MERSIQRVILCFFALFFILGVYLTYIQFFQGELLSSHALNRRNWDISKTEPRGNILDRDGNVLARSVPLGKEKNTRYTREYPKAAVLAPVTGFVTEKYGKAGVEDYFNQYLTGIENPQYRLGPISTLWKRKGYNIVLSINSNIQQTAYAALGAYRGAVVVMDPRTGEILAMVSKPTYDPNDIDDNWEATLQDTRSLLLNRALQGLYPPGSAIKPLIAAAALEERVTDNKKIYKSPGYLKIGKYTLNEANGKALGNINLERALALSSNVAFGQMGLDLGREKLGRYFEKFGFGQTVPLNFPLEKSRLPQFSRLADGELAQTAVGQGELLVTPLDMALMTSALANRGITMKPILVSSVTDDDGRTIKSFATEVWLRPISSRTAETVKTMMGEVVEWGTGTAAAVPGLRVAGKTGTAENPHGAPHAWFVGMAPLEKPEIVVVVVVENGGAGGGVAAPIARRIFEKAL